MEHILTPEQMRIADNRAINTFSIPGEILMENAARSAFEFINEIFYDVSDDFTFFIFCGSGNNGGDGFALARHLNDFFRTKVYWLGSKEKMSPETLMNYTVCANIGMDVVHITDINDLNEIDWDCDCIIDSMIGVGGSENIRGFASEILTILQKQEVFKIAVDAPTGLNTLTGAVCDNCFEANITITMYSKKIGQLIGSGPEVCGEIFVANLGAPASCVEDIADIYTYETMDMYEFFPKRPRQTSKFDYGRIVIIAGSKKYPGAAVLAANAAIKTGVGLIELFSPNLHPAIMPEVICLMENQGEDYWRKNIEYIQERCQTADAVLLGPGLGNENIHYFKELFETYIKEKIIILDADAISLIDKDKHYNNKLIITPHSGEFSRLTGLKREEIENNSYSLCKEWAKKLNCIIHLKSTPSVTSDSSITFLTTKGNPGMATAGSGDVLSGIIAALAGLGFDSLTSASLGGWLHASAGDTYAALYGENTLTATEIINCLPLVIDEVEYDFE